MQLNFQKKENTHFYEKGQVTRPTHLTVSRCAHKPGFKYSWSTNQQRMRESWGIKAHSLGGKKWNSCRGSAETNLSSIHEDTGSTPGLTQCVQELALL